MQTPGIQFMLNPLNFKNMKKILLYLLLLCSISTFAQAEFPEGIQLSGNASTVNSTKLLNQNPSTGTLDYINATSLPVSTATANALDLKVENSSGAIQGFAITNNGDGTVNIATGTAYLRTTNDPYAPLIRYVIPAVTNLALTDNANNFVLVDYNGGSPALTVTISSGTVNTTTNSITYVISRVGTTLDYISLVGQNVDPNAKLRRRFLNSEGLRRANGAVLTASSRNLILTAGLYYSGLIEVPTPAFNTSTGSTFTYAYENTGVWTRTTGNAQINNTQYSLNGVLTSIPTNDYRVDYTYILADNPSKLYVLLGTTTYANISLARLAPVPTNLPSELQVLGTRVGRTIIQKDATTTETTSEFATIYQAGTATLHNDLGGLNMGDFQHLTVAEKANNELKTNKQNSLAVDGTGTKYPTVDAVNNFKSESNTIDAPNIDFTGLGDSISYGQGSTSGNTSYLDLLNSFLGFKSYTKLAVSSTSVMPKVGQPELYTQVVAIPAGTDLITVMIGVNDFFYGNALGDVQTVLNKTYASLDKSLSFTEAFRYNLETIRLNHPNAKVVFITPIRHVNSAPSAIAPLIDYINNSVAIANYLNIPVVNAYNNSGIFTGNATTLIPDTVHPSDAGYSLIYKLVLQNLIATNQESYTGYLKQDKLTNPVTGTGTVSYAPIFTGSTSIGNSKAFYDGNGLNYKETDANSYSSFTAFNNDNSSALQFGIYNTLNANANKAFMFAGGAVTELGITVGGQKRLTVFDYGVELTGNPTAPTPTLGDNDTSIATTKFVQDNAISNAILRTGDQSFTGAKSGTISGSEQNSIYLTNLSTATGSGSISIDVSSTGSGNGQRGINIANNNSGGGAAGSQAMYIDNNSTGYGTQIKNFSTGRGNYYQNFSSGLMSYYNSETGSTGDLIQFAKNNALTAKVNQIGEFTMPKLTMTGTIELKAYTVATLPTGVIGAMAYATDALAPTYMTTVVGGGAVVTPVFYNGTNWVAH